MSGPFSDYADDYLTEGWQPFPVVGKVGNVPKGITGHGARAIGRADVWDWILSRGGDNVALHMDGVIGIDVDHYVKGDQIKRGGDTLALAEAAWGELPATWRSTSRDPGTPSGIRFYRVPPGDIGLATIIRRPDPETGELISDIEVIQFHHRYAVVWPSIHPDTGEEYRWYHDGSTDQVDMPNVEELPWLPQGWLDALAGPPPAQAREYTPAAPQEAPESQWHPKVTQAYQDGLVAISGAVGSRHDSVHQIVSRLAAYEAQGSRGATTAMYQLGPHFVAAVDAPGRAADREYERSVKAARDLVAGTVRTAKRTAPGPGRATTRTTVEDMIGPAEADEEPEPEPAATIPDGFWDGDVLVHILAEAEAAGCNPVTVLTVSLARVATILGPRWQTGRARGIKPGSLSTFVALIGAPGAGKTRHAEVPRDLIPHPVDKIGKKLAMFKDRARPGSAAGLAALFEEPADPEQVRVRSAWCEYDEGSQLLTFSQRQGEPIVAELCSAWAGGDLSTQLRSKGDSRRVEAGGYALGLSLNLQTAPAARLLASQDIGLPQRFLWCLAAPTGQWDPEAWGQDVRPTAPVEWTEPDLPKGHGWKGHPFTLPDVALRELHHLTNPDRGQLDDPLSVHHPYLQSKLASALAGLHGRPEVTEGDWWRAGVLVDQSAAVRRSVAAAASIEAAREREQKRLAGARDAVVIARAVEADEDARHDEWVAMARPKILEAVRAAGGEGAPRRDLLQRFNGRRRAAAVEALALLVESGAVTESDKLLRVGVDQ